MNSLWCAHLMFCYQDVDLRAWLQLLLLNVLIKISHNFPGQLFSCRSLLQVGIAKISLGQKPDLVAEYVETTDCVGILSCCPCCSCTCTAFTRSVRNLVSQLIGQKNFVLTGDSCLLMQKACCDAYQILISVITSDEQHW